MGYRPCENAMQNLRRGVFFPCKLGRAGWLSFETLKTSSSLEEHLASVRRARVFTQPRPKAALRLANPKDCDRWGTDLVIGFLDRIWPKQDFLEPPVSGMPR